MKVPKSAGTGMGKEGKWQPGELKLDHEMLMSVSGYPTKILFRIIFF